MSLPDQPPDRPPFRCSQHVAWPLGEFEHLVVDRDEILHIRPGYVRSFGIYTHAEEVAEELAEVLAPGEDVPRCGCGDQPLAAAWRIDAQATFAEIGRRLLELKAAGYLTAAEAGHLEQVAADCRDEALDTLPKQVPA